MHWHVYENDQNVTESGLGSHASALQLVLALRAQGLKAHLRGCHKACYSLENPTTPQELAHATQDLAIELRALSEED